MGKLAKLSFGEGSFEQGFSVTFQVGDEMAHPSTNVTGYLPAYPELLHAYAHWQSTYTALLSTGIIAGRPLCLPKQTLPQATLDDCHQAAQQLGDRLNAWLRSDSFHPILTAWLTKLQPADALRVLLQTSDPMLQKLPWHLWSVMERYPKAEIALSAFDYDQIAPVSTAPTALKILAILGNSDGIDTEADRKTLEQIAGGTVQFLPEPPLKELTDALWQQPWRLLFFAGHSASQNDGSVGRVSVNASEQLSISELKHALRTAAQRGLQLAIFNSCDGLGLARELGDLHIPQLIVMREPVPDYVAQQFLKYFLNAFSRGATLYQAVREARERLQGLENRFPCATWLPVIYQNPAAVPPTWQALMGTGEHVERDSHLETPTEARQEPIPVRRSRVRELVQVAGISLAVTASIVLGRYFGLLQPLELQAYDHLMRLRPAELPDPRLLVITIDETDLQSQPDRRGSLSDAALNNLLETLNKPPAKPRAIGLDIYWDFLKEQTPPSLVQQLKQNTKLVVVCRVRDEESNIPGIKPPADVGSDRLGFSDLVEDPDGVIRRHLLFIDPDPGSPCAASDALSFQLALRYLAVEGIQPNYLPDGSFQLGSVTFPRLQLHTGGYHAVDTRGSQMLLNYRQAPFEQVSLQQVLKGEINPHVWADRLVLIGVTARSAGDYLSTPYGQNSIDKRPGVMVQAQMVSQILSAVKDQRPLIWSWSQIGEMVWIGGWSLVGGLLIWFMRSPYPIRLSKQRGYTAVASVTVTCGAVLVCCYGTFTQGGWIPLVPTVLAIVITATAVSFTQTVSHPSSFQR